MGVSIKSAEDIVCMRLAGRLASEVLDHIAPQVAAGITTGELDGGRHLLAAGEHKLKVRILPMNPVATPRNMFGLDFIKVENLYTFDGEAGYSLGQGQ